MARKLILTTVLALFLLPVGVAFSLSGGTGPGCSKDRDGDYRGQCVHIQRQTFQSTRTEVLRHTATATATATHSEVVTIGGGTTTVPAGTATTSTSVPGPTDTSTITASTSTTVTSTITVTITTTTL